LDLQSLVRGTSNVDKRKKENSWFNHREPPNPVSGAGKPIKEGVCNSPNMLGKSSFVFPGLGRSGGGKKEGLKIHSKTALWRQIGTRDSLIAFERPFGRTLGGKKNVRCCKGIREKDRAFLSPIRKEPDWGEEPGG